MWCAAAYFFAKTVQNIRPNGQKSAVINVPRAAYYIFELKRRSRKGEYTMSIKAEYQTESYIKRIATVTSRSVVECRFSFGDGVSEVLAVSPQLSPAGCEVSSGRVNYGGRLVCTAVYADVNGNLNRSQKGAEFTHFADDDRLAPSQTAFLRLSCERATVRRDGSSFLVTAVICADIEVFGAAERTFVSAAEGAVCRFEPVKLLSAVTFSGESEVEDDFEAAGVEDILTHDAKVLVTDCRCGGGEVRISGELYLSLLAVRGNEPVALDRAIPFTAEILCDEAVLPVRAICCAQLKEATVSAQVNEERARCGINFNAQLTFFGWFFTEHETGAATDAFRTGGECAVSFGEESAVVCNEVRAYSERVGGLCTVKAKIDYSCAFKVVLGPKAECTYSADTGMLEGAVTSVLVYSREGEIHSTEIALPFSVKLGGTEGAYCVVDVAVNNVSVRQRAEGECEAEASLKITAAVCSQSLCSYVTDVAEGPDDERPPCAISVLLPHAGETLWSAAKRLKMPPEQVAEACGGAAFPLSGDERIVIYRPKK